MQDKSKEINERNTSSHYNFDPLRQLLRDPPKADQRGGYVSDVTQYVSDLFRPGEEIGKRALNDLAKKVLQDRILYCGEKFLKDLTELKEISILNDECKRMYESGQEVSEDQQEHIQDKFDKLWVKMNRLCGDKQFPKGDFKDIGKDKLDRLREELESMQKIGIREKYAKEAYEVESVQPVKVEREHVHLPEELSRYRKDLIGKMKAAIKDAEEFAKALEESENQNLAHLQSKLEACSEKIIRQQIEAVEADLSEAEKVSDLCKDHRPGIETFELVKDFEKCLEQVKEKLKTANMCLSKINETSAQQRWKKSEELWKEYKVLEALENEFTAGMLLQECRGLLEQSKKLSEESQFLKDISDQLSKRAELRRASEKESSPKARSKRDFAQEIEHLEKESKRLLQESQERQEDSLKPREMYHELLKEYHELSKNSQRLSEEEKKLVQDLNKKISDEATKSAEEQWEDKEKLSKKYRRIDDLKIIRDLKQEIFAEELAKKFQALEDSKDKAPQELWKNSKELNALNAELSRKRQDFEKYINARSEYQKTAETARKTAEDAEESVGGMHKALAQVLKHEKCLDPHKPMEEVLENNANIKEFNDHFENFVQNLSEAKKSLHDCIKEFDQSPTKDNENLGDLIKQVNKSLEDVEGNLQDGISADTLLNESKQLETVHQALFQELQEFEPRYPILKTVKAMVNTEKNLYKSFAYYNISREEAEQQGITENYMKEISEKIIKDYKSIQAAMKEHDKQSKTPGDIQTRDEDLSKKLETFENDPAIKEKIWLKIEEDMQDNIKFYSTISEKSIKIKGNLKEKCFDEFDTIMKSLPENELYSTENAKKYIEENKSERTIEELLEKGKELKRYRSELEEKSKYLEGLEKYINAQLELKKITENTNQLCNKIVKYQHDNTENIHKMPNQEVIKNFSDSVNETTREIQEIQEKAEYNTITDKNGEKAEGLLQKANELKEKHVTLSKEFEYLEKYIDIRLKIKNAQETTQNALDASNTYQNQYKQKIQSIEAFAVVSEFNKSLEKVQKMSTDLENSGEDEISAKNLAEISTMLESLSETLNKSEFLKTDLFEKSKNLNNYLNARSELQKQITGTEEIIKMARDEFDLYKSIIDIQKDDAFIKGFKQKITTAENNLNKYKNYIINDIDTKSLKEELEQKKADNIDLAGELEFFKRNINKNAQLRIKGTIKVIDEWIVKGKAYSVMLKQIPTEVDDNYQEDRKKLKEAEAYVHSTKKTNQELLQKMQALDHDKESLSQKVKGLENQLNEHSSYAEQLFNHAKESASELYKQVTDFDKRFRKEINEVFKNKIIKDFSVKFQEFEGFWKFHEDHESNITYENIHESKDNVFQKVKDSTVEYVNMQERFEETKNYIESRLKFKTAKETFIQILDIARLFLEKYSASISTPSAYDTDLERLTQVLEKLDEEFEQAEVTPELISYWSKCINKQEKELSNRMEDFEKSCQEENLGNFSQEDQEALKRRYVLGWFKQDIKDLINSKIQAIQTECGNAAGYLKNNQQWIAEKFNSLVIENFEDLVAPVQYMIETYNNNHKDSKQSMVRDLLKMNKIFLDFMKDLSDDMKGDEINNLRNYSNACQARDLLVQNYDAVNKYINTSQYQELLTTENFKNIRNDLEAAWQKIQDSEKLKSTDNPTNEFKDLAKEFKELDSHRAKLYQVQQPFEQGLLAQYVEKKSTLQPIDKYLTEASQISLFDGEEIEKYKNTLQSVKNPSLELHLLKHQISEMNRIYVEFSSRANETMTKTINTALLEYVNAAIYLTNNPELVAAKFDWQVIENFKGFVKPVQDMVNDYQYRATNQVAISDLLRINEELSVLMKNLSSEMQEDKIKQLKDYLNACQTRNFLAENYHKVNEYIQDSKYQELLQTGYFQNDLDTAQQKISDSLWLENPADLVGEFENLENHRKKLLHMRNLFESGLLASYVDMKSIVQQVEKWLDEKSQEFSFDANVKNDVEKYKQDLSNVEKLFLDDKIILNTLSYQSNELRRLLNEIIQKLTFTWEHLNATLKRAAVKYVIESPVPIVALYNVVSDYWKENWERIRKGYTSEFVENFGETLQQIYNDITSSNDSISTGQSVLPELSQRLEGYYPYLQQQLKFFDEYLKRPENNPNVAPSSFITNSRNFSEIPTSSMPPNISTEISQEGSENAQEKLRKAIEDSQETLSRADSYHQIARANGLSIGFTENDVKSFEVVIKSANSAFEAELADSSPQTYNNLVNLNEFLLRGMKTFEESLDPGIQEALLGDS